MTLAALLMPYAEDIGDFQIPTWQRLQRITGVAIERQRGEGTTVTVRGFGADFNLVTLNGRQMPTHSGLGRAFDFQDIASESVSGVEVYKTSRANIPSGGSGPPSTCLLPNRWIGPACN
ncbi:MAG: hypothetical protein CM15mP74_08460 [Halieaceae bacterium]|nr:MAG: hypothetical protein CM15mP74_08460 [Halieaceae bacterium]